MSKQMWDQRYADAEYVYGTDPNEFFKLELDKLKPGRILLPAEGEGRNAAYAAGKGWDVWAFDQSEEGRKWEHEVPRRSIIKNFVELHVIIRCLSINQLDSLISGVYFNCNSMDQFHDLNSRWHQTLPG